MKIKELREQNRIQQEELAEYLCISQSTLSRIEKGLRMPSLQIAIRLADYFDVSLDELVGRERK